MSGIYRIAQGKMIVSLPILSCPNECCSATTRPEKKKIKRKPTNNNALVDFGFVFI